MVAPSPRVMVNSPISFFPGHGLAASIIHATLTFLHFDEVQRFRPNVGSEGGEPVND